MQLSSKRITLSPFDETDKVLFIEFFMCPKTMKHIYAPFTYEEAVAAFEIKSQPWTIKSNCWLSFSISALDSGEKLGHLGLKITNHEAKIAEIGYMIKQSAQGKGFAAEALDLVKDYGFDVLQLNKLTATCSAHNTGSFKLLEKLGFIREGCLQQNSIINNRYVDDYVYGLCK
ncbi:GNAT family N-acetyltransferase [Shewanella psychropiezotolerans]|uniref:GNAT family N-acetyltransferase n=1 Tax=Shewanella psychropiezotolerans TaxID=2593655 RepID=A0ABX5X1Z3_9GAMM|nr:MULTISPECIES: GNAT family protein [Shewanella]MPY24270.1 GNAT family N-acetyltransferase [Shewanella sp. YLB-07]QDO84472.1 GNAT family N-acetyltransferase [Shewanella psychropiezotolerans]